MKDHHVGVLYVPRGKNPYQWWLCAYLVFIGFGVTFGAPAPNSVTSLLDPWVVRVWGASLLLGGVLILVGMYWRGKPERGVTVEVYGSATFAVANMVYPIALTWRLVDSWAAQSAAVRGAWTVLALLVALSLAATRRVYQLRHPIKYELPGVGGRVARHER